MLLKFLQCFDTVGLVAEGRLACKNQWQLSPTVHAEEKNHRAVSCCSAYCINWYSIFISVSFVAGEFTCLLTGCLSFLALMVVVVQLLVHRNCHM